MGNPNPDMSGLTPFEKGKSGNPGGKTKAQREAEVQSAEDSAKIRALMTRKLLEQMTSEDADPTAFIDPSVLKLLKDSEDRGHGTPVQSVNVESPNGTMTPKGMNAFYASDATPED